MNIIGLTCGALGEFKNDNPLLIPNIEKYKPTKPKKILAETLKSYPFDFDAATANYCHFIIDVLTNECISVIRFCCIIWKYSVDLFYSVHDFHNYN